MKTQPRFRSQVIAAIRAFSFWKGKVDGYVTELRKRCDKDHGHVIQWRILVRFVWLEGESATVAQALEDASNAGVKRFAALQAEKRRIAALRAEKAAKKAATEGQTNA